ncbi:hypothetical protein WJX72_005445 [[Myrmecia] bisecta]|uniref:Inosine/uridine-preferring nucleoside hydrolase domain-containing protein n=1 Tax=[Myrmecia] bisecta TaxID=41462 RepID=A0AAW1QQL2_9CHLO
MGQAQETCSTSTSPSDTTDGVFHRIAVWCDVDPGHDDALAIVLAGHSKRLELLGVSTVAGNQTIEKVTQNALDILDASGMAHIDVVAGQAKPLIRHAPILCPEIHGESGLDGPDGTQLLPRSGRRPLGQKAVPHMFSCISGAYARRQQKVQLVCTGALTNAALLLILYPEVVDMLEIVLMGGCMGIGNTGPVVEFNIQTDPEAAKVVFECGARVTMIPLEVTHTAIATPVVLSRLCKGHLQDPTPYQAAMMRLLVFFAETYKAVFSFDDPPLHDPCAVAYVICPDMFKTELMRVDVETHSALSAGQTVCDVWHQTGRLKNVHVAKAIDTVRFWDMMIMALHAADAASPLNSQDSTAVAASTGALGQLQL